MTYQLSFRYHRPIGEDPRDGPEPVHTTPSQEPLAWPANATVAVTSPERYLEASRKSWIRR